MVSEAVVDELAALLGWSEHFEPEISWAEVEAVAGCALPSSFKQLMSRFPSGTFGDRFTVYSPAQSPAAMAVFINNQFLYLNLWDDTRRQYGGVPYPLYPEAGGLLPWGTADDLCLFFRTLPFEDPDRWPCVLGDRLGTLWQEYAGTAPEFLLGMLSGQLPDYFEFEVIPEELQFYPIHKFNPPAVIPSLVNRIVYVEGDNDD